MFFAGESSRRVTPGQVCDETRAARVQKPPSHLLVGLVMDELVDNALCLHPDNTFEPVFCVTQSSTKQLQGVGCGQSAYVAMTEKSQSAGVRETNVFHDGCE